MIIKTVRKVLLGALVAGVLPCLAEVSSDSETALLTVFGDRWPNSEESLGFRFRTTTLPSGVDQFLVRGSDTYRLEMLSQAILSLATGRILVVDYEPIGNLGYVRSIDLNP